MSRIAVGPEAQWMDKIARLLVIESGLSKLPVTFVVRNGEITGSLNLALGVSLENVSISRAKTLVRQAFGQAIISAALTADHEETLR